MLSFILALVAMVAYLTSSIRLTRLVLNRQAIGALAGLSLIGLAAHVLGLAVFWLERGGLDFQFLRALSLVSACAMAVLLSTASSRENAGLGLILQPWAAFTIVCEQVSRLGQGGVEVSSLVVGGHVTLSMVALGLFSLATLQALLLALQEAQMKNHQQNVLTDVLPPLDAMETYLFRLVLVGYLMLTAALLSGIAFTIDLAEQHLIHKTVLTILAWIVMAVLLIGRRQFGWRGKTAVRCTVGGYSLLVLGYFGSKFVVEFVLT